MESDNEGAGPFFYSLNDDIEHWELHWLLTICPVAASSFIAPQALARSPISASLDPRHMFAAVEKGLVIPAGHTQNQGWSS